VKKLRSLLYIGCAAGLSLLLSACHAVVLQPKGWVATQEKELLIEAVWLMLIVVVPVILLTIWIGYRYRRSNEKAKYTPNWSHSNLLEFIWWLIPCIIIVILGTMTWIYTHRLDPYKELSPSVTQNKKPIQIQVVALRWRFLFIYPKEHIATVNQVIFPAHTPVDFVITADAPMNSFQIPALGGQIYAMNGMQTKLHLIASEEGKYRGGSVSFSGDGFSGMRFFAYATTPAKFQAWVNKVRRSAKHLTWNAYNMDLVPASHDTGVIHYGTVSNGLYKQIIQKFMTPNRHNVDTSELGVHL